MHLSAVLVALSLTAGLCSPLPAAETDATADAAAIAAADATAAGEAAAGPAAIVARACDAECETDKWVFNTTNADFNQKRDEMLGKPRSEWGGIDWINPSDGCSVPPGLAEMFGLQDKDKPRGYDFVHSCYRHDFGYANFQQQKRFTPPNRKRIDDMFLNDLFAVCTKEPFIKEVECRAIASAYYSAVRLAGGINHGD